MPYLIDAADARWGHKMGGFALVDAMYRDGFQCSLCGLVMGETAELLAREYGIAREASDAFCAREPAEGGARHRAPARLTPGTGRRHRAPGRRGPATLARRRTSSRRHDTGRPCAPDADLHRRRHARHHHAGIGVGITDGGAAVVLASERAVQARGLQPLARVTGWASAGVDPRRMGIGPVPAVQKLLAQQHVTLDALRSGRAQRGLRAAGAGGPARTCRFRRANSTSTAAPSRSVIPSAARAHASSSRWCTR